MPSKQHRRTPEGRTPEGPARQHGKWQPRYRAAGLGIELLGAIAGFTLVGLWIDGQYGTSPWGLLVCVILGFVGGFYNLIRASLEELNPSPEKKTPRDHGED